MDFLSEAQKQQISELTEHHVYLNLAKLSKEKENKKVLSTLAQDELHHHNILEKITQKKVKPQKTKIVRYTFLAKLFGVSFALKLMEKGEKNAVEFYQKAEEKYPQIKNIKEDELKHEKELLRLLKDSRLTYAGAIVLGLNDALVELTGTLAGLTLAFQNSLLIGITGLIMGLAASLSMAASGYLSSKEEEEENKDKNPITAAIYTGIAYIITVLVLVSPYFMVENVFLALASMLILAISIIFAYSYYISVAKEESLKDKFSTMVIISMGVALISFIFGYVIKSFFNIEV